MEDEPILVVVEKQSRLSDPSMAYSLWSKLNDADREASRNRAKVDAMVNGEPPFDQSLLDETGQGDAANFNTREAAAQVNQVCAAYYDLVTSNKSLVTLKCEYGDLSTRYALSEVIAEEFTNLVRNWDSFEYWYNVMVRQHVVHGIGVCFFPDETDWRFRSCGLADFKLPRDCPATEESITLAAALIPTDITELYNAIQSNEGLDICHWDIVKLKELVIEASKDILSDSHRPYWDNWEYVEKQIKENALYFGSTAASRIWLIHFWIKEDDGSISHGIIPKEDTKATSWLYFNQSRFEDIKQAFVIFPYDIGAGTYHTIRGLGYVIQPQVQANNALACRMADGAMASTMNLLKISNANQTDLERMAVAHFGNNEVLPPGLDYIERRSPDYTNTVLPVINFLQNQLRQNNLGARPQIPALDKNAPAIAINLEAQSNAAISASALNRFYTQLDKLFSEMFRRVKDPAYMDSDPAGKLVLEFRKRLKKRKVPLDALDYITEIKASRSVGAGSAANRLLAYQRLERLQGAFDPEGKRNLVADIVSEEVGYDNVDRYLQPLTPAEQRAPIDVKIAEFENLKFEMGKPSSILPNQDHFTHINVHMPIMAQALDNLSQLGDTPDVPSLTQVYTLMMAALPHCAEHINIMSEDVARRSETKNAMQVLQQLQAASDRLRNQIVRLQEAQAAQAQAEMQRQQEAQAAYVADLERKVAEGGPDASAAQAKLIDAQVKNQIREMEFRQRMEQRQLEFNQKMALKDAEAARKLIDKAQLSTQAKPEQTEA
jgi:hypothetical protein